MKLVDIIAGFMIVGTSTILVSGVCSGYSHSKENNVKLYDDVVKIASGDDGVLSKDEEASMFRELGADFVYNESAVYRPKIRGWSDEITFRDSTALNDDSVAVIPNFRFYDYLKNHGGERK